MTRSTWKSREEKLRSLVVAHKKNVALTSDRPFATLICPSFNPFLLSPYDILDDKSVNCLLWLALRLWTKG